MAGHTQGQGINMDVISRELFQNFVPVSPGGFLVGRMGNLEPDMLIHGHTSKTVLNILFDGVDHNGLALVGGAGLGESIQLFPLWLSI